MSNQTKPALSGKCAKSPAQPDSKNQIDVSDVATYLASMSPTIAGDCHAAQVLIRETATALRCLRTSWISRDVCMALDDSVAYCRRLRGDEPSNLPIMDHSLRLMISCNTLRSPDYAAVLMATHRAFCSLSQASETATLYDAAVSVRSIVLRLAHRTLRAECA